MCKKFFITIIMSLFMTRALALTDLDKQYLNEFLETSIEIIENNLSEALNKKVTIEVSVSQFDNVPDLKKYIVHSEWAGDIEKMPEQSNIIIEGGNCMDYGVLMFFSNYLDENYSKAGDPISFINRAVLDTLSGSIVDRIDELKMEDYETCQNEMELANERIKRIKAELNLGKQ